MIGIKELSLFSSLDHYRRLTPSEVSDTLHTGFETAQILSSDSVTDMPFFWSRLEFGMVELILVGNASRRNE